MIDIIGNKCTGCSTCTHVCPFKAITMNEENNGFFYPTINLEKCRKCKKCYNECPQNNPVIRKKPIKVYAAFCKNKIDYFSGSSGGVFGGLAKEVLDKNGVVFGCYMDDDFIVKHIEIRKMEDLKKIKKSKYVQSYIGESFFKVKEYLDNNILVLFTGTPCQIAGLKKYLKIEYDNLITVDVLCHGVPSNKIFKDFIYYYEKKHHCRIKKYDFRFKDEKLGSYITYIETSKNKKCYYPWQGLSYSYLFMKDYILRECCYDCQYVDIKRVSDITLGDYWNIEKKNSTFSNKLGVSMILLNTSKGIKLFNKIKSNYEIMETSCEDAVKSNPTLHKKNKKPNDRELLIKKYKENGYIELEKYYKKNCKKSNYYKFVLMSKRIFSKKVYNFLVKVKKRGSK